MTPAAARGCIMGAYLPFLDSGQLLLSSAEQQRAAQCAPADRLMSSAGDSKLLHRSAIITDIGPCAYASSIDYRRTSPDQGAREFLVVSNARATSSRMTSTGDAFQCIQDWVSLTPPSAKISKCVVLDKSSTDKYSLFVVSAQPDDASLRSSPPQEVCIRVDLAATTAPATSVELSRDKKRLYLLDALRERAEVLCTTSWKLLASGPIERV